jgi:hypothetical protein
MSARAKGIIYAAAALAVAAAAQADVGSVISSFRMTGVGATAAKGIYRGDTFVYAVVDAAGDNYLRIYTTAGSLVGSVVLAGADSPRDADHSLLGSGYVDVFDYGKKMLLTYALDGSLVNSKAVPSDTTAFAYIPGTQRYFLARDQMIFRYTLNDDVLLNKFYVGGDLRGLAASGRYDGKAGQYLVAGRAGTGGYSYVYSGAGSLIDSFVVPGTGTYGSVAALGAFDSTNTYWCVQTVGLYRWAYQVDIGAASPAVVPASVGRLKALYR